MVAGLAEEKVAVGSQPAQHIDEEFLDFDVLEVHQQPVAERQIVAELTQSAQRYVTSNSITCIQCR